MERGCQQNDSLVNGSRRERTVGGEHDGRMRDGRVMRVRDGAGAAA